MPDSTTPSMTTINRRTILTLSGAAALSAALPFRAGAASKDGVGTAPASHGLSIFDDLKYPADFSHFDYINPQAPKGGAFRLTVNQWLYNQSFRTFNTLNTFSALGDAPPRMEYCFDTLMKRALDEPDAIYGLIAESVRVSEDGKSYSFKLRPQARFHDDTPITAHDVAFSYQVLKEKGHPSFRLLLAQMESAIAEDDRHLRLTLKGDNTKQNRRLIMGMAIVPVLSKTYYSKNNFDGNTLTAPLGSGAYKVGALSAGQFIEYVRVENYWAKNLNVNIGSNNFDRIRVEFFRDSQPAFEAFKKGILDWRAENASKSWANDYDFSAVQSGKVIKNRFPNTKYPKMQSWALNQRRERFRDPRVREAIAICFDFEWSNKNLFYDLYERVQSNFSNSTYEASGKANTEEQAVIARHAALIDDTTRQALLDDPVMMPVTDGSGRNREQLRHAANLMKEAGFERKGEWLVDKNGEIFTLEILNDSDGFNRIYNPMIKNLHAIGINASVRMAEASGYQKRMSDFDYDMIGFASAFTGTPDSATLALMYGSESVNIPSSQNFTGTSSPLVDALIADADKVQSRDELTAVISVLDRLLRYQRDWIPCYSSGGQLIAYWDKFGMNETPPYGGYPEYLWWFDKDKAERIGKA